MQWATELPGVIVWVHVVLATLTWLAVLWTVAAAGRVAPRGEAAPRAIAGPAPAVRAPEGASA